MGRAGLERTPLLSLRKGSGPWAHIWRGNSDGDRPGAARPITIAMCIFATWILRPGAKKSRDCAFCSCQTCRCLRNKRQSKPLRAKPHAYDFTRFATDILEHQPTRDSRCKSTTHANKWIDIPHPVACDAPTLRQNRSSRKQQ